MTASLLPDPFGAPFVLLEDRLSPAGEARLYTAPERIIAARTPAEAEEALAALEAAQRDGLHLAGFLAYEFGHALEPRLSGLRPDGAGGGPLLWFGAFPAPRRLARAVLDAAFAARPAPQPLTQVAPGLTEAAHAAALARVRGYLEAGDAYQVNLTFPIRFRFGGIPSPSMPRSGPRSPPPMAGSSRPARRSCSRCRPNSSSRWTATGP